MKDYQKRMLDEHSELKDRLTKLNAALAKDGFREKVGDYQFKLMREQAQGMEINPNGRADSWVPSSIDVFAEDWEIVE